MSPLTVPETPAVAAPHALELEQGPTSSEKPVFSFTVKVRLLLFATPFCVFRECIRLMQCIQQCLGFDEPIPSLTMRNYTFQWRPHISTSVTTTITTLFFFLMGKMHELK